jgi:hypothetical protein
MAVRLKQFDTWTEFADDSPLEGDGFEPSVPHKKQPFLAAPVRSRNSPSATKTGSFAPGTDGSNPSPSSGESANHRSLEEDAKIAQEHPAKLSAATVRPGRGAVKPLLHALAGADVMLTTLGYATLAVLKIWSTQ